MQSIKQQEPFLRPWQSKLFSHSLKLLNAASPASSKAQAVLSHIKSPLNPPKKTTKSKKKDLIIKSRDPYMIEVDKMVRDYAIEKDIPVQIPMAIRRDSYKGFRITEESQPGFTPRHLKEKGTPRTNKLKKQKSQIKYKHVNLRQRINTQMIRNEYSELNKSPTLPTISRNSSSQKKINPSPLMQVRDPELQAVKMKLCGNSSGVSSGGLTSFQRSAIQKYMRFPTEI